MPATTQIRIYEARPTGVGSFDFIVKRMQNGLGMDDVTDVWKAITPDIKDAFKYTFSEANPNAWAGLSGKYLDYKIKRGYPATIGVLTGTLKKSLTEKAVVKYQPQQMSYSANEALIAPVQRTLKPRKGKAPRSRTVGEYAGYFDKRRPVVGWARDFIKDVVNRSIFSRIFRFAGMRDPESSR